MKIKHTDIDICDIYKNVKFFLDLKFFLGIISLHKLFGHFYRQINELVSGFRLVLPSMRKMLKLVI